MARRINFTGRRKLMLADIHIQLDQKESDLSFRANLRLDDYKFPHDAHVFVEAYRGLSALWKRFDFGRIGLRQTPPDLSLTEFDHPQGILFRVKVTAASENRGRLLGEADGVRPQLPGEDERPSTPLIEVDREDMKGELWRVAFPEGGAGMPTLVMNADIEDWNTKARDPVFQALVMPAVMRQILAQILIVEPGAWDETDPTCWQQRWLQFAESGPGMMNHPDCDADDAVNDKHAKLMEWIDDAVRAFGQQSGLANHLLSVWNAEGQP